MSAAQWQGNCLKCSLNKLPTASGYRRFAHTVLAVLLPADLRRTSTGVTCTDRRNAPRPSTWRPGTRTSRYYQTLTQDAATQRHPRHPKQGAASAILEHQRRVPGVLSHRLARGTFPSQTSRIHAHTRTHSRAHGAQALYRYLRVPQDNADSSRSFFATAQTPTSLLHRFPIGLAATLRPKPFSALKHLCRAYSTPNQEIPAQEPWQIKINKGKEREREMRCVRDWASE
ncbi:hypothetical protein V8C34DRAFT_286927 [Trichoderma compactum]